ncbi:MAG: AarF/UbiB family protein [Gammaproteobacteria bacterium]
MQNLARILFVLNTIARYRLLALLPGHPLTWPARALLWLFPGRWLPAPAAPEAARLRLALEELGPIFVKLGQLLATRRDLFDDTICDELAKLQDQVAPFPDPQAHALIARELGQPASAVFARIDASPLAAASVAQVYGAQRVDGRDVVIKLLRPGIEAMIEADLSVMRLLSGWLERWWEDARFFQPSRLVTQYADTIHAEVDLRREAQNSERMRLAFAHSPLLHIPPMHMDLVTRRMLVSDRMYGVPVTDVETIDALGIDRRQLAERGVEIFFTQVFRDNFFHADMHPGNIFVSRDRPQAPQYIAIDCAIAGTLTRADQLLLARLTLALIQRDWRRLVRLVEDGGWLPPDTDLVAFENEVAAIAAPVMDRPIAEVAFAPTVLKLFALARNYRIQAPVQFMLLIKTLAHIEGLGRRLYPQLDIWTLGRPLLEEWLYTQFSPVTVAREFALSAPDWLASLPNLPRHLDDALRALRTMERREGAERDARRGDARRLQRTIMLAGLGSALLASGLLLAGLSGHGAAPWLTACGVLALVLGLRAPER